MIGVLGITSLSSGFKIVISIIISVSVSVSEMSCKRKLGFRSRYCYASYCYDSFPPGKRGGSLKYPIWVYKLYI